MVSSPLSSIVGRIYVASVILAGLATVAWSAFDLVAHPLGYQWLLLAVLTVLSGSATVRLPSVPASISISETFVFASVLLYGPSAGTVIVALDGLVISFWIAKRRQESYRALFNMAAPAISVWAGATLFFFTSGILPLRLAPASLDRIIPSLLLFSLTYFSINSWLIALAISLERKLSAARVWKENFIWLSLNYLCGASVAVLLVAETRQIDLRIVGVIVPLLLVLYFTFKTSMDRVEDANEHVRQVNGLYLSTIETLALAIDAKDQVTHGHIRRVQRYTVGLARELGVTEPRLLQAIEAAALLHDMGKLAIPEHILNKPGKLTTAEFEEMKIHSIVGADILSSINFPYPVVPIVRHHHEAWDGSGYPDGLAGTDIPIGARILAVVDCFDALTSDRPYRRRLSNAEALKILNDRKGSMYDPWVVCTFERVHLELESEVNTLMSSTGHRDLALSDGDRRDSDLRSVSRSLAPSRDIDWSIALECEAVIPEICRSVKADAAVFFRYDSESNTICAQHAEGHALDRFLGTQIRLGERLSGWVAANRRAVINSDAALDLQDYAALETGTLSHTLSVPVATSSHLIGVISLYASHSFSSRDESEATMLVAEVIRFVHESALQRESPVTLKIAG